MNDAVGYAVSGASPESLEHFETACDELRCFYRDPVATVDRALAASPELVMGYALKAWLHLLGTEPAGIPVARECHRAGAALPANDRERRHLEAVRLLAEGHWHAAGRALEDLSIAYPLDSLALQAGHQIDFFTGQTRMLRDRIARALPAWSTSAPAYHALLGMHAFGLEECGNYAAAESTGRRAVETQPRDSWAQHAVAHVLEMQGRQRDGIAWMRTEPRAWAEESFFAAHNWWHVALYHLDLNEVDAALEIFDGPVFGKQSSIVLDMVDASALLWRLHLRGVPLADRWEKLARNWFAVNSSGSYAFNDFHQMMALVGAGRLAAADELLAAQAAASERDDDNSRFTRDVGLPACRAVRAFADGRYGEVVQLLRPVRSIAHRFGGSHAQRDLIDLTLFEAALRGGEGSLAAALSAERIALKPASPFARLVGERAGLGAPGAAKEGRVKRTG